MLKRGGMQTNEIEKLNEDMNNYFEKPSDDVCNTVLRVVENVLAKKLFAGPEQVINYLGQYTYRIAISNYRLVKIQGEKVIFKVRDKKKAGESKLMSLPAKEFLRLFLLHVLPKGFVRIRHFGILVNRYKKEKIKLIRKLENIYQSLISEAELGAKELLQKIIGVDLNHCPKCNSGELIPTADIKGVLNSS